MAHDTTPAQARPWHDSAHASLCLLRHLFANDKDFSSPYQADNGTEFMAYLVRDHLLKRCIKHRPIPPGKPHLYGKVERSQQTMLTEFYAITTFENPSLEEDLGVWLLDYNHSRIYGSLGKAPMQRWTELNEQTPMWEDVVAAFDPIKEANYVDQLTLCRRKPKTSK